MELDFEDVRVQGIKSLTEIQLKLLEHITNVNIGHSHGPERYKWLTAQFENNMVNLKVLINRINND